MYVTRAGIGLTPEIQPYTTALSHVEWATKASRTPLTPFAARVGSPSEEPACRASRTVCYSSTVRVWAVSGWGLT